MNDLFMLATYYFNGYSDGFEGNFEAVDELKNQNIEDTSVKSLALFKRVGNKWVQLERYNYTRLKEIRKRGHS